MADEFAGGMGDEGYDPVAEGVEGLPGLDEADQAADLAERTEAASPDQPSKDEGEPERFEYTAPDGSKIEGTFEEIVAARAAEAAKAAAPSPSDQLTQLQTKIQELEGKLTGRQAEGPAQPGTVFEPVDKAKVGTFFQTMLEGGDPDQKIPGMEGLGDVFEDLTVRTFMHSTPIADGIRAVVQQVLDQREGRTKSETGLKELAGEFPEAEIAAYQKDNPHIAPTREMAMMALRVQAQAREIESLKAGKPAEVKAAEKKAAAATLQHAKATGTLRRLGTAGRTAGPGTLPYNPKQPHARENAWAAKLKEMRGEE